MKASVNGVSLYYEDEGSGAPLFLIHGFPLSSKIWSQQIAGLKADFRVIAPDLRGFGMSEAPSAGYSMDVYADDIAALMAHLGLESAVVCGMSMGGYVLLNLIDRYPERVKGACFMVTRCGADDEAGKARRTALAEEVLKSGVNVTADLFGRILFAPGTAANRPELVTEVAGLMRGMKQEGIAGGLLSMRERPDYCGKLAGFTVPSLVIGGEEDQAIPVEESRILAERLPHASLRIIPEAGHMVMMEQPEAVNSALKRFLRAFWSAFELRRFLQEDDNCSVSSELTGCGKEFGDHGCSVFP
jgi:3-oxoadipate enol-lactonase